MPLIIPILMILAAGGLFFGYAYPKYPEIKLLRAEANQYEEALAKSAELQALRDELNISYAAFSKENLDRLSAMIPSNFNVVQLAYDLDSMASVHGLSITNLNLLTSEIDTEGASEGTNEVTLRAVDLEFQAAGRYEALVRFLQDLERSLRIMDVTSLTFGGNEEGGATYMVTVRVYALR